MRAGRSRSRGPPFYTAGDSKCHPLKYKLSDRRVRTDMELSVYSTDFRWHRPKKLRMFSVQRSWRGF